MDEFKKNLADLIKVKSLVTLSMTAVMIAMLVGAFNPPQEFITLFCTSYGSIITYFFTKDEKSKTSGETYDAEPTNGNFE